MATERGNLFRPHGRALRHPWLASCTALAALVLAVIPHLDMLGRGWIPGPSGTGSGAVPGRGGRSLLLALGRQWVPALLLVVGSRAGIAADAGARRRPPHGLLGGTVDGVQRERRAFAGGCRRPGRHHQGARRADVVVLVEVDEELISDLLARGVKGILPYRSPTVTPGDTAGTAILSRFPLKPESRIPVAEGIDAFDHPSAVIEHPRFGPIRVAAVHPHAPVVDGAGKWRSILGSIDAWQSTAHGHPHGAGGGLQRQPCAPGIQGARRGTSPTPPPPRAFFRSPRGRQRAASRRSRPSTTSSSAAWPPRAGNASSFPTPTTTESSRRSPASSRTDRRTGFRASRPKRGKRRPGPRAGERDGACRCAGADACRR